MRLTWNAVAPKYEVQRVILESQDRLAKSFRAISMQGRTVQLGPAQKQLGQVDSLFRG